MLVKNGFSCKFRLKIAPIPLRYAPFSEKKRVFFVVLATPSLRPLLFEALTKSNALELCPFGRPHFFNPGRFGRGLLFLEALRPHSGAEVFPDLAQQGQGLVHEPSASIHPDVSMTRFPPPLRCPNAPKEVRLPAALSRAMFTVDDAFFAGYSAPCPGVVGFARCGLVHSLFICVLVAQSSGLVKNPSTHGFKGTQGDKGGGERSPCRAAALLGCKPQIRFLPNTPLFRQATET